MKKNRSSVWGFLFVLEFHEFITLVMLFSLALLYRIGLSNESIRQGLRHLIDTFGIVEKTILFLLLMLLAIMLIVPKWRWGKDAKLLFRVFAAFFMMLLSFEAITFYIKARAVPMYDSLLQYGDSLIFFGKQPAVWMESITSAPLTYLLSAAYLSWFILTYGTVFLMVFKGKRAVIEYAAVALLTFYIGYVIYMFVPAFGPLYTFHFSTDLGGLSAFLINRQPVPDAFPSLHTALSVIMLIQVWKYYKRWAWLYIPVSVLIIFSTVYLRIHYALDVLAGIALALLTALASPWILTAWERKREQALPYKSAKIFLSRE